MKKFLVKIVLFAIISTMLSLSAHAMTTEPPTRVSADPEDAAAAGDATRTPGAAASAANDKLNAAKADFLANDCIPKGSQESTMIIDYIEEPFGGVEEETIAGTEIRRCFRKTFSFYIPGTGAQSEVTLSRSNCKENQAYNLSVDDTMTDYEIKYSCREIQVLISPGGTSLIYAYIGLVYRWAAGMVGVIAVLVVVLSGIQISVSGGDSEAVNKAKGRILKSLAGIAVLFLSGIILYTVNPTFFVAGP